MSVDGTGDPQPQSDPQPGAADGQPNAPTSEAAKSVPQGVVRVPDRRLTNQNGYLQQVKSTVVPAGWLSLSKEFDIIDQLPSYQVDAYKEAEWRRNVPDQFKPRQATLGSDAYSALHWLSTPGRVIASPVTRAFLIGKHYAGYYGKVTLDDHTRELAAELKKHVLARASDYSTPEVFEYLSQSDGGQQSRLDRYINHHAKNIVTRMQNPHHGNPSNYLDSGQSFYELVTSPTLGADIAAKHIELMLQKEGMHRFNVAFDGLPLSMAALPDGSPRYGVIKDQVDNTFHRVDLTNPKLVALAKKENPTPEDLAAYWQHVSSHRTPDNQIPFDDTTKRNIEVGTKSKVKSEKQEQAAINKDISWSDSFKYRSEETANFFKRFGHGVGESFSSGKHSIGNMLTGAQNHYYRFRNQDYKVNDDRQPYKRKEFEPNYSEGAKAIADRKALKKRDKEQRKADDKEIWKQYRAEFWEACDLWWKNYILGVDQDAGKGAQAFAFFKVAFKQLFLPATDQKEFLATSFRSGYRKDLKAERITQAERNVALKHFADDEVVAGVKSGKLGFDEVINRIAAGHQHEHSHRYHMALVTAWKESLDGKEIREQRRNGYYDLTKPQYFLNQNGSERGEKSLAGGYVKLKHNKYAYFGPPGDNVIPEDFTGCIKRNEFEFYFKDGEVQALMYKNELLTRQEALEQGFFDRLKMTKGESKRFDEGIDFIKRTKRGDLKKQDDGKINDNREERSDVFTQNKGEQPDMPIGNWYFTRTSTQQQPEHEATAASGLTEIANPGGLDAEVRDLGRNSQSKPSVRDLGAANGPEVRDLSGIPPIGGDSSPKPQPVAEPRDSLQGSDAGLEERLSTIITPEEAGLVRNIVADIAKIFENKAKLETHDYKVKIEPYNYKAKANEVIQRIKCIDNYDVQADLREYLDAGLSEDPIDVPPLIKDIVGEGVSFAGQSNNGADNGNPSGLLGHKQGGGHSR